MRPTKLRSTALAVTAGLLLGLLPTGAHADALGDLEAQIQRYQQQLAQINSQTISVQNQVADTQARIDRYQVVLAALNAQLLENNARQNDHQARHRAPAPQETPPPAQATATPPPPDPATRPSPSQLRVLDKVEARNTLGLLLTSHSFGQFFQRVTDIRQASDGTNQTAIAVRADRDLLAAQHTELDRERTEQAGIVARIEEQRQALEQEYSIQDSITVQLYGLRASLGQQQSTLVSQANTVSGDIASSEAQLQSLLAFSHGQGGNIVAPEYLANSWGSYYNQRDARWGNVYLGRTQNEVWEIGCLLTDVAMVNSHFGFPNVTPGVIAANPANFTPGGLLYNFALNVPGHPAMINNNPSRAWINQVLANGGTVIVGMYIRTGGTHFVTLVAQNGPYDYWINDPWEVNAMHVSYLSSPVTGPIYDAIGYNP